MVNFTACGIEYVNNSALIAKYNYTGPVRLINPNPNTQITYAGCLALCGDGNDYYPWDTISSTLTTWILPLLSILLQAPFESNAFWRTCKAICRWVGSPMASFAYILWNIEVSGKCALFVDMAVPYDEFPDENSEFADIRDAFYLLMNFNQYTLKPLISMTKEAESLLRLCLFSKSLHLVNSKKTLFQRRRRLVAMLRSNRRRGVVPVFISTLWFLLAVGISIESAFGEIGSNSQAHDLAMGLMMGYFPILILCSIVDRNPVASDDIRAKLNKLVDLVCDSLIDPENRRKFINSFTDMPNAQIMANWVERMSEYAPLIKGNFFQGFAGQARQRFHYGAAHAILIDIEKAYIADHGRGWLQDQRAARAHLILGQADASTVWFDGRQAWQISSSILIVVGNAGGAFLISLTTPTVGLGCRSGGQLIFVIVSFSLLLIELSTWIFTSPIRNSTLSTILKQQLYELSSQGEDVAGTKRVTFPGLAASKASFSFTLSTIEYIILKSTVFVTKLLPLKKKERKLRNVENAIKNHFSALQNLTARQWVERVVLTPLEFCSLVWLCYILFAQTIGAFNNCMCQTSIWGPGGGYMDFTAYNYDDNSKVRLYWILGTSVSCTFLGLGMIYVLLEWLIQAHLSTENYKDAMEGLKRVRRFRRVTYWARYPASLAVLFVNRLARTLHLRNSSKRKALLWTKDNKSNLEALHSLARDGTDSPSLPFAESPRQLRRNGYSPEESVDKGDLKEEEISAHK